MSKFKKGDKAVFFNVVEMCCPEEMEGNIVEIVGVDKREKVYTINCSKEGTWGAYEHYLRKLTKLEKALK